MRELLKNKVIIVFSLFILSITYIDSANNKKMKETDVSDMEQYITMNIK